MLDSQIQWHSCCRLLIVLILSIGSLSGQHVRNPCSPSPCGTNTNCQVTANRAVCSCLPGHIGNPIQYCTKGECLDNKDCSYNQACSGSRCRDVCSDACGKGAKCDVKNHIPVCSCPKGYTGDPFNYCHRSDPIELCHPSPCGANTKCDVINNTPVCSCLPGYKGSALHGCFPECQTNKECRMDQLCTGHRCRYACVEGTCGRGAHCESNDHKPVCVCPEGYIGNPYDLCTQECYTHTDCPTDRPSCSYGRCSNPCKGVCGQGANCRMRDGTAICSCPKDMTGDPFQFCRPFTKNDLCEPNPCGNGAVCHPGKDSSGEDRPVCTCPPGYVGNALHRCLRGECIVDDDCSYMQYCEPKMYKCRDVCADQCGVGAMCTARRHQAICACKPGYTGDATHACSPLSYRSSHSYRLY